MESEVRGYSRMFPAVFDRAEGSELFDVDGRRYLDFFAGAGALNYGHNDPAMRAALVAYIQHNGVVHSLDMATAAKGEFLQRFHDVVLEPRGLEYKVQFPGPTGTNSVEAALKLARKITGRHTIVSFTNAFHGMTLGALSITGNSFKRHGAGVPLTHSVVMPYCNYFEDELDSLAYLDTMVADDGSGVDKPAAIILETVQAEGGINVASEQWLRGLAALARGHEILIIVDDIQAGCGRTGPFFSFERAGIEPDLVCLSKSLSGYGLPLSVLLIKPELDVWEPGEHNGTFRGHNLAFVSATAALSYWKDDTLPRETARKGELVRSVLDAVVEDHPQLQGEVRGLGLINGIACPTPGIAAQVVREAFSRQLIIETAGPDDNVVKVMPPLVIDAEQLSEGLQIVRDSVRAVVDTMPHNTFAAMEATI
ncbi:MAG: diaminobutyrate--2-oxoglutarate transaminase [Proteobacteria bacterium]|nr:diaminobutyrate--2-oxoglutarate transaminase [Pseudomonadota bacterium]